MKLQQKKVILFGDSTETITNLNISLLCIILINEENKNFNRTNTTFIMRCHGYQAKKNRWKFYVVLKISKLIIAQNKLKST